MTAAVAPDADAVPLVSLDRNGAALRAGLFAAAAEDGDDPAAVQVVFDDAAGAGRGEFIEIDPDFNLMVSDCFWRADGAIGYRGEDWVRFNFCLDATASFDFADRGRYDLRGQELRVFHQPAGLPCLHRIGGGARSVCVTMSVRREALIRHEALAGLPGLPDGFFFRRMAMPAAALRAVDDLLRMPYRRALRRGYAGAKAQELLCTALQALAAPQDVPGGGVLHDGDRERISRARAILDDSFADPPTVAVLARTVGLNRNKLSYGFRHLHDRSMSDYLAEKRLDAAWRLLQDGVPVGAVAEAVGYRHVGSFSAAFSRRYGLAPSSLRRNKCGTPKSS